MFVLLVGLLLIALYYYGTRNFDYWRKRGVKYEKPIIFFGGFLNHFLKNISLSERFSDLYRQFPGEQLVGYFEGNEPAVIVRDVDLMRRILTTDFKYFHNRGLQPDVDYVEPMMKNLFCADGDIWKLMRTKLTSVFTSGKLKAMFPLIVERTEKLVQVAEKAAEENEEVDVRDLMAKYTTDFIGACGFGIDSHSLREENSDFRKLGQRIFSVTPRDIIVNLLKKTFPETFKYLRMFDPVIEDKMVSITKQIMSQRNYQPSGRNDFIDMMLELKQKGNVVGESIQKKNKDGSPVTVELELDDMLIAAQVFIFFAAGFETSSSVSSYLLHLLAYHPEIQERCRQEVDDVLARYDGKLSFEAVKDMKYLEMALRESIRVSPPVAFLIRKTISNYNIPGSNVMLEKGTVVIIPGPAVCSDEKYFDNPEEFRPERFHPDNIGEIKKYIFPGFGEGPRTCIGERMGMMQSMAGLATILRNFTLAPSRSSIRKPRLDPKSIVVLNIAGGLPLSLKRRQITN